jgi:hypothetical protein
MNMPAASTEEHVVVAHRPGDILVLCYTKIRRIPSTKSRNNNKTTTSEPTSSLQSIHLVSASSVVVDNNERQRHAKKPISPDLKKGEKPEPPT